MAIIWVDPYIGSVGGAATGTVDTTTRDGTYAAPLKLIDICSASAVAPAYNGVILTAGDEIRIKGLTTAQWKITTADTWYLTTNNVSENTFRTTALSGGIPAAYVGAGAAKRTMMWVDACPGFGGEPAIFLGQSVLNNTTYYSMSGSSTWYPSYCYPVMGTNQFSASFINFDYALSVSQSNYYLFYNLVANVAISDGWTDATTQGGKTFWISPYAGACYFIIGNASSNTTSVYNLDLSRSYFIHHNSASSYSSYFSLYAGVGQTVKVGGVVGWYNSSPICNMYSSPSCTLELGMLMSPSYGANITAWSTSPARATITIRNLAAAYQVCITGTNYSGQTLKVRCLVGGTQNTFGGIISAVDAVVEFLAGAIIRPHNITATTALFVTAIPTVTGVIPTRSYAGMCSTLNSQSGYPAFALSQSMTSAPDFIYSGQCKLDPVDYTKTIAFSFAAQYNFDDVYRWTAQTDARDYRTIDVKLVSSTAVTGDTSRGIHFATNAFDAKPLALIFSAVGKTILLYNEVSQNNALAFQSATDALGENFYKRLPLNLPDYAGAAAGVRFDFEYATSAGFTTGEMGVYLVGISGASGAEVLVPDLGNVGVGTWTVSGVQTAPATLQYVVPKSWLTSNAITQMQVKLRFKSGSGTDKFYVRAMNLTAV